MAISVSKTSPRHSALSDTSALPDADTEAPSAAEGAVKVTRAEELFGKHYPKLQRLKRKYDPEMIFNKWYVIQPAASEDQL